MSLKLYPNLILDTLRNVRYPGSSEDIVSAGMVEDDIRIEGNKVSFSIRFPKHNDPFAKSVIKAAESTLETFISPDIEVKGNIQALFPEPKAPERTPILPDVKNIIAISSGKGGVGKSTITANLAVALAMQGYRVGLLDADIFGPSVPKMFRCEDARPFLADVEGRELIEPVERYGVKLLSIGFFVNPEDPILWRGAMATNALNQLITQGNWGELDFLLLDLPPGTSDIHLSLIQTIGITGAVIVTTPQDVALADARKGVNMFLDPKVNVPVLGVVENMAWFTPAELPENRYYIFGKDGGKHLAEEMNTSLLAQVPLVQSVREAGDDGEPIAHNTESIMGLAFHQLAGSVIERTNVRNETMAPTQKVEVTHK